MDSWHFFIIALLISIGAILVPYHEEQSYVEDDDNSVYPKTDPDYVFRVVDPEAVEYYDDLNEESLMKMFPEEDWKEAGLGALTKEEREENLKHAAEVIREQNTAYKNHSSPFYCGPSPLSILGSHAMEKRTGLLNPTKLKTYQSSPSASKSYVENILKKLGNPPDEFHTRKSMLTSVKDQGQCGSCLAFASVASVETAFLLHNPTLNNADLDLAEQTLLTCARQHPYDNGCNGTSLVSYYIEYLSKHHGGNLPLEEEDKYSPKEHGKVCLPVSKNYDSGVKVNGLYLDQSVQERDLKALLIAHGAVVVGMNVGEDNSTLWDIFRNYKYGIIDHCLETKGGRYHAATIVGYGEHDGKKYWDIKNSWGESWGDKGYFKMERGINCNEIETQAVVPLITKTFQPLKTKVHPLVVIALVVIALVVIVLVVTALVAIVLPVVMAILKRVPPNNGNEPQPT